MVFETRKQSMAWMELRLQASFKRSTLSMEDKMAAGAFEHFKSLVSDVGKIGIFDEDQEPRPHYWVDAPTTELHVHNTDLCCVQFQMFQMTGA